MTATDPTRADADEPLTYERYLQLQRLLSCQSPISAEAGQPSHDEMLFIITHQAFELWFHQILVELESVVDVMGQRRVPEKAMGTVVARLRRVVGIQRLLVDQLEVLETMTPLDFLDFRGLLAPASGFQSEQFRLIENRLGLDPAHRLKIGGADYAEVLPADARARIRASEAEPTLAHHIDRWLARTPLLRFGTFDFWAAYREAVEATLAEEADRIATHPNLSDDERAARRAQLADTREGFATILDGERWEAERARGRRRLSHAAVQAALLIHLYRDEPLFQLPFALLTALVDVDEHLAAWRWRHALLAHRMIGARVGTGGSAGRTYLEAAAKRHRIFTDLFDLPTYFLPRSQLPELPEAVREQLQFRLGDVGEAEPVRGAETDPGRGAGADPSDSEHRPRPAPRA